MFTVFVEGLELYAYHGVPDEEQALGHRYRIDVRLELDGGATTSDDVEETVDYALVAKLAQEYAQSHQFRTVERLAAGLAQLMIERFDIAETVWVRVAKLLPPAPHVVSQTGVEIRRSRKD
jgi:7,8-dihydroneopterin aldolase/epimerase/oxygenase